MKAEIYRVAERHALKVLFVSNSPIALPRDPMIERVIVPDGVDKADDWIAERARPSAIVMTADILTHWQTTFHRKPPSHLSAFESR